MRKKTRPSKIAMAVIAIFLLSVLFKKVVADDLPARVPDLSERRGWIRNPLTFGALNNISKIDDPKGLYIDLENPKLQGMIHTGPYPFKAGEADYNYVRYRESNPLMNGNGLLQIDTFFSEKYNANDWTYDQRASKPNPTIACRLEISDHGFYDSREGGGGFVNGYSSSIDDFRLQFWGWKQSMAGFWRSRPVYTAMGSHEALVNVYDDGSRYGISLDKWPYETSSVEAIFAE